MDDGLQNMQYKIAQEESAATGESSKRSTDVKLEQSSELPSSETLALENVQDKLQQMLQ